MIHQSLLTRTLECSYTLSVDIQVQSPQSALGSNSYVPSFATGETITGVVSITSQSDLAFENLHIYFIGEQSTSIPSNNPAKASHEFLKLIQQIDPSTLPTPRVLQKKRKYEIPFSFEVTDYLPSSACPHSANPLVKAAHLHVPPSCGDASISGFGGKLRDDSAPAACKVAYAIVAKLERPSLTTGVQETMIERRLKIRIKPLANDVALPELPVAALSEEYRLYHEETVLESGKRPVGQLAVSVQQPDCFNHPLRDSISLVSKAIRVSLVYTPNSSKPPPELKSLRGQIIVTTIYTTTLTETQHPIPRRKDLFNRPVNYKDAELPLSIPSLPQLRWTRSEGNYTATLLIPVTLPKDKSFIPTFHSCLISRVYSLAFQLSVQGVSAPLKMRVPMQIAAERDPAALPSYNAALGVVDTNVGY
ncbi:hypothetical protein BJX99DRAFT_224466 [Aspergillus californicus]